MVLISNQKGSYMVFKQGHPEQKEDEIFLGNFAGDFPGWKTTRKGCVAYDVSGKAYMGAVPCFVKRQEIKNAVDGETKQWRKDILQSLLDAR